RRHHGQHHPDERGDREHQTQHPGCEHPEHQHPEHQQPEHQQREHRLQGRRDRRIELAREARPHPPRGAAMSTTGEPCWIQLTTADVDSAISFYGDLFGWSAGAPNAEYQDYRMFFRGERPIAGLVPTPEGVASAWSVFLATSDLAGT